jgi:hypothetical protein
VSIIVVTGPPGAGKSFYATKKAAEALDQGRFLVTNYELAPDTLQRVGRRNPGRRFLPGRVARYVRKMTGRVLVADELADVFRTRMPPPEKGLGEGRGWVVLDEAHTWCGARDWNAKDRKEMIRWFSRHRKLGWDVYLIVQDLEMLDSQVRKLAEYEVQLRNIKKARVWGIPVWPFGDLFLAKWYWAHNRAKNEPARMELYTLGWQRKLYDTMQTNFASTDVLGDGEDLITLPYVPGPRPHRPAATESTGPVGATDGPNMQGEDGQALPALQVPSTDVTRPMDAVGSGE